MARPLLRFCLTWDVAGFFDFGLSLALVFPFWLQFLTCFLLSFDGLDSVVSELSFGGSLLLSSSSEDESNSSHDLSLFSLASSAGT